MAPELALDTIMKGNERFATDQSIYPDRTSERRKETADLQQPFAIILGCSDSRVAPEILFDQGIGDLFIVRVAGNVVGAIELDSIDYSALYLNSSLILVLGHENCGAVSAVINKTTKDIEAVASLIAPAARKTKDQVENRLENTIKENVRGVVMQLKLSPVISKLMKEEKIDVRGGYYHFKTGRVELL